MLQAATLLLALALSSQDRLTITGELKDVPAQGKESPYFQIEGSANLGNGAVLLAYLYYGKPVAGREISKDTPIVKNGKFNQEFPVFSRSTFPGTWTARITFDPNLQNLGGDEHPITVVDFKLQIGTAEDVDREGKAVRERMIGEIQALIKIADEMKAKLPEMKDKTQAEREVPVKAWHEQGLEIRKRVSARNNPEYYLLRLDLLAETGFEELLNILNSCARCFALNQAPAMAEGLTRLRQSCDYYIGEVRYPKLTDPRQVVVLVEEARALARKVLENPDQPVLPARRRFLEIAGILQKSIPGDYHEVVLGATSRAAAFFNAASDKSPDLKALHADLDGLLERFIGTIRGPK